MHAILDVRLVVKGRALIAEEMIRHVRLKQLEQCKTVIVVQGLQILLSNRELGCFAGEAECGDS
jgi:hypothetical protein